MRQPHNVLVFLFKRSGKEIQYAVFRRINSQMWQAISGGVEDEETFLDTVRRELREETGMKNHREMPVYSLSSKSTIPVTAVTGEFTWGKDTFVVTEHAYAVEVAGDKITLSGEHSEYRWVPYEEARKLLTWDSNRNALWELNERLQRSRLPVAE